jgi:hypothetical protein
MSPHVNHALKSVAMMPSVILCSTQPGPGVCHRIVREDVSRRQWEVLPRCEYQPTEGLSHRLYAKQGDETNRFEDWSWHVVLYFHLGVDVTTDDR